MYWKLRCDMGSRLRMKKPDYSGIKRQTLSNGFSKAQNDLSKNKEQFAERSTTSNGVIFAGTGVPGNNSEH